VTLRNARGSTWLFLTGITAVVLMGVFPGLRPYSVAGSEMVDGDQVSMGTAIMITMIAVAGLTMSCSAPRRKRP
jgi:anaerobic C4-dicarboxylate transporter